MRSGPSKPVQYAIWGSSLPAVLAASFLYYPAVFDGPVICVMPLVAGIPCPGCGLTRAFCCMMHGEFGRALGFHALAPLILAYFVFLWVVKLLEIRRGERLPLPAYKIGGTACLVLMAFWVVRLAWFFAVDEGLARVAHDNLIARLIRLFG